MGGARSGPSYFKEGDICSYAPEPNYTDFQQNISMKASEITFFLLNLSSKLAEGLEFHFV